MSVSQNAQPQVCQPKIFITSSDSTQTLATAVATQVNTLVKQLRLPAKNQTAGDVLNDSIIIDPVTAVVDSTNQVTYICSVRWQQFVTPS